MLINIGIFTINLQYYKYYTNSSRGKESLQAVTYLW